jgi:hypothetical protein
MTHEGETSAPHDEYWTGDILLVEDLPPRDGPASARLSIHQNDESYPRGHGHTEILPVCDERGTRAYLLAHPYRLLPDLTITVGLSPTPAPDGAIGTVEAVHWEGMHQDRLGDLQAWYYPTDRTLILWEVTLFSRFRTQPDQT